MASAAAAGAFPAPGVHLAAPELRHSHTVTTELVFEAPRPSNPILAAEYTPTAALLGFNPPTGPAQLMLPTQQQNLASPESALAAEHSGLIGRTASGRLVLLRPSPAGAHRHHLLGATYTDSPQMLLNPPHQQTDSSLLQQHQQQLHQQLHHHQQQQQVGFLLSADSRFNSLIPNIDPAQLLTISQDGGNAPLTAAAAAAAFGSAVGLDMLVEPSAVMCTLSDAQPMEVGEGRCGNVRTGLKAKHALGWGQCSLSDLTCL
jgi:hypothetical protein